MNLDFFKRNRFFLLMVREAPGLLLVLIFNVFAFSYLANANIGNRDNLLFVDTEGEPKVVGRLALSRQDGMFSEGGLLGGCGGRPMRQSITYQVAEFEARRCHDYLLYKSQIGGQAMLFHLLTRSKTSLIAARVFSAMFLAGALTVIIAWIKNQFGLLPALVTALGTLCFRALALFGDNISQVLGVEYLILAAILWTYEKGWKHLGPLTFGLFALKIFISGYEYMIPAVFLAYVPLVYYGVRDGYDFKRFRADALAIAAAIAAATIAGTLVLTFQIAAVDSFRGAVAHFGDRLLARTYFPTPNNRPYYFRYMDKSLLEVFLYYYRSTVIWIGPVRITYTGFVAICSLATLAMVRMNRKASDPKIVALAAAMWFSLVGAVLWIVLMKGHSATHWFIDPIVWQMPFAIFAVTYLSVLIGRVFALSRLRARGSLWPTP